MEQIRQILAQLSMYMELNIAMCDKLEDMDKRVMALESSHKALQLKHQALSTTVHEQRYVTATKHYEEREAARKGGK